MNRWPVNYAVLRQLDAWDARLVGLDLDPDGVLALARVPDSTDGQAVAVAASSYDIGSSGLALGPEGDVLVADTAGGSLVRVMGGCSDKRFVLGKGKGGAPGPFNEPRGIAIGAGGLYLADSGNGRVLVFRLPSLELRDVWEEPFQEPVTVAVDDRGRVYVADRALERVLRVDAAGAPDAAYNLALSRSALRSPAAMAIVGAGAGGLAVSDDNLNRVLRFDVDGGALSSLDPTGGPARPRALVARADRLYVADADGGRIWVYREGQGWLGTLPGYRGPVTALALDSAGRLYVKPGLDAHYLVLQPDGACVASGVLVAGPFDAGEQSVWERVNVEIESSPSSTAELRFFLADVPAPGPTAVSWTSPNTLAPALDTLVPPPRPGQAAPVGQRYLWLRLQLRSDDGHTSARVFQVQAATTAESYLNHLPAVYARDDGPSRFLERWLALFRAEIGDWEQALGDMPRRLDPEVTDVAGLQRLARWLAFELPRRLGPSAWRRLIPEISRLYERRGTPFGLRELCELYTGARPQLFEAFAERHVWSLGETSRLGFDTALAAAAPGGIVVPGSVRADPAYAGLLGDYYAGTEFDELKQTRIDAVVSFDWQTGSPFPSVQDFPSDAFSVRWTGQIRPRYSEVYTFSTISDDGVRLWIDGRLVIDNWTDHPPTEDHGRITLDPQRWYAITLEYYEKAGGATISLSWSSRSQLKEIVPQERMYALLDEGAQAGGGAAPGADATMVVGQAVVGASGPLAPADYGAPLFEDYAHLFTVLMPAAKLCTLAERALLKEIIEAEKPAHTDFHLCFVEPRMRVGFQARLGIDSIVAGPPAPLAMTGTVLGKDSYLGDGEDDGPRSARLGKRARVGRDAIVG